MTIIGRNRKQANRRSKLLLFLLTSHLTACPTSNSKTKLRTVCYNNYNPLTTVPAYVQLLASKHNILEANERAAGHPLEPLSKLDH